MTISNNEKISKETLTFIIEWAIWAKLSSKKDLELILLKGHLLLEVVLDTVLVTNEIKDSRNFSFHRKISLLRKVYAMNCGKQDLICSLLSEINQLRNKMAHENGFDINNGEFESWGLVVLENFVGTKFTNYTFKTKIVHAFSVLAKNILDLSEPCHNGYVK